MAENEKKGVGVKVTPTIPADVYAKLEVDAEINGMKAATRIGQIVSLFYNGKLALVDVAGVQNVVVSAPTTPTDPVAMSGGEKTEDKPASEPKVDKTEVEVSSEKNEIQALNKSGKKSRRI